MQLLAPDILEDARELSVGVLIAALVIGLLVWLLGWRGHRFWIVLGATATAGILGLCTGSFHRTQPVVAGLLMAVAAGAVSLALIRVVAFAAGGLAAWAAVHALIPSIEAPLVSLMVGGLLGLILFRLWTMVLTSSMGTLLMAYSSLCLIQRLGNVDAVALAEGHTTLLNCICAGVALAGVALQYLIGRPRGQNLKKDSKSRGKSGKESGGGESRGPRFYRRAG
jgi:hypothetical protein